MARGATACGSCSTVGASVAASCRGGWRRTAAWLPGCIACGGSTTSGSSRWSRRRSPATRCSGAVRSRLDRAVKVRLRAVSAPTAPSPARTADEQLDDRVIALVDQLLEENPPKTTDVAAFLGAQFDLGLAWVHFPEGNGGLGLSPKLQRVIQDRIAKGGGPHPYGRNPIGYGMGAPTIVTHGSDAQKQRYLRPLFTGEEVWCQLFSEPGAGPDVASLSTRAIRDGDEWVVNGQKVWTTLAHLSRWGMLIARTDPDTVKHKGMTYFVVDMHGPGVEVRPLYQITGEAEFNEVYYTDVRIPDGERLGDVGEGWHVSLTTLMNERVSIGGQVNPRGSGVIAVAVNQWKQHPDRHDP